MASRHGAYQKLYPVCVSFGHPYNHLPWSPSVRRFIRCIVLLYKTNKSIIQKTNLVSEISLSSREPLLQKPFDEGKRNPRESIISRPPFPEKPTKQTKFWFLLGLSLLSAFRRLGLWCLFRFLFYGSVRV